VGRYSVLDRLGGGAMGVVYSAYDPELDRKVALKLLRPDLATQEPTATLQARLLREAQAMARLQHPNVLAVYDVGTFRDRVFVAMELVEGTTLRAWLGQRPRTIREITGVFLQAGKGLAAAHAVGMVHRDFKPDNVLLGTDGRVRVGDFGLARATDDQTTAPSATPAASPFPGGELTHSGTILGTPAYMSPEQLLREAVDARSDQFSFCVALYEALYGERPFDAKSFPEFVAEVVAGRIREAPRDRRVPARLRQLVQRGMARQPGARWPSMDALLAQLGRDSAQARRRWMIAAGASVAVAAILVVGLKRSPLVCRGASAKLAGVWDDALRRSAHARFSATGLPYAEDAFRTATRVLDRYAADWATMHTQACEATRVRGEQSEELLDLRMQCLSNRREELRAVTGLFGNADGQVVEKAAQVAGSLGRIDQCADTAALKTPVRPPTNEPTRAQLETVRRRLAEARALERAGKYPAALPMAQSVAKDAHALGYQPLEAEALFLRGRLEYLTAHDADGQDTLIAAAAAAMAGRDDTQAARTWTELVRRMASAPEHAAEAHRLELIAQAAVDRVGGDELRGDLAAARASVYAAQEDREKALAADQLALDFFQRAVGPDDPRVGRTLTGIGTDLMWLGRSDEALASFARAIESYQRLVGPDHPDLVLALSDSALILSDLGRFDESLTGLRRAVAIREHALGANHPEVASALVSLAEVLERTGRLDEARSAAIRSQKIFEDQLGAEASDVAWALNRVAKIGVSQGRFGEALAQYRRALAIWEKTLGTDDTRLAYALTGIGCAQLGLHDARAALAPLERARRLRTREPGEPMLLAETDFALARALAEAGGDRERARHLASDARAGYLQVQAGYRRELSAIEAWLATAK
jgi:tetratricopeptide (TPR) repeat protein